MKGPIRLAGKAQVLALAVAWLGVCMAVDYRFNRHLWAGKAETAPDGETRPGGAPLSLWINHLCCTGCLDDVQRALRALPWLKDTPMTVRGGSLRPQDEAQTAAPAGEYGGWLDVAVKNLDQIDFVAIDQALRGAGFVASRMQFGGARHFRLEGRVHHMCCEMCRDACERIPELGRARQAGRLRWLDSAGAERSGGRLVFHVRYQEPEDRIDVTELLAALDEIGLPPFTLKPVTAAERTAAPDAAAAPAGR